MAHIDEQAETEFWYRAEGTQYAGSIDEYGDPIPGSVGPLRVSVIPFRVHHHTAKGVVLVEYSGTKRRFVNATHHKRFASPTEKEALEAFIARKKRQISILQAQTVQAQRFKFLAESMLDNEVLDRQSSAWEIDFGMRFNQQEDKTS